MSKRKLVGVIVDTLDGEYQQNITLNLIHRTIGTDVKMLFFVGSALPGLDDRKVNDRKIFYLAHQQMLDGLFIVPATMIEQQGEEKLRNILQHFGSKPVVSIGIPMSTTVSVLMDNKKAMAKMIGHMKSHVAMKDICFISGPLSNKEAFIRHQIYLEFLKEEGIKPEEGHCYIGDFLQGSGREAVDYFLDRLGYAPKAIVAANDNMAIGAYERLTSLGIHIPQDTKVSGLDNILRTKDIFPPITTYDQRMDFICGKAIESLTELMKGRVLDGDIIVQGELVVRESCGCNHKFYHDSPDEISEGLASHDHQANQSIYDQFEQDCLAFYRQVKYLFDFLSEKDTRRIMYYSKNITAGLVKALTSTSQESYFMDCVNDMINFTVSRHSSINVLAQLDELISAFLMKVKGKQKLFSERLEILMHNVHMLVNMSIRRQENEQQYNFRRMYLMSRTVTKQLDRAEDIETLGEVLKNGLPHYGIKTCYIVLYKRPIIGSDEGETAYPALSELVFGFNRAGFVKKKSFATKNILPSELMYSDSNQDLMFLSLDSDNIQFGYIVFSNDSVDFMSYESLRVQISETLNRFQLNQSRIGTEMALKSVLSELESSNKRLMYQSNHDVLTGLYNRRGFYQAAEKYYQYAMEQAQTFYVIFADIDGLKSINDTFGHNEGDFTIKKVGEILRGSFDFETILARMSGDEFTAIVKNTSDINEIDRIIDSIKKALEEFNELEEKPYPLGISIGYVASTYTETTGLDELLRLADRHLYRIKRRKKDTNKNMNNVGFLG